MDGSIYIAQYVKWQPEKVWEALISSERRATWWVGGEIVPVAGHKFTLDMGRWGMQDCEVLTALDPCLLEFRFGIGTINTTMTWKIRRYDAGTELALEQSDFDLGTPLGKAAFEGMGKGWSEVFRRAAEAMGGVLTTSRGVRRERESLESGKAILRKFDHEGRIEHEAHYYEASKSPHGDLHFAKYFDKDGEVYSECFFVKGKAISKKKYGMLRLNYVDMPQAGGLTDPVEELKALRDKKLADWKTKFDQHIARPELAAANDAQMLKYTKVDDALLLDDSVNPAMRICFGEQRPKSVKTIREQLAKLGFLRVWAIDLEIEEAGERRVEADARGAVLELPQDPVLRKKAFAKIARDFVELEFDAPVDNGQQFEYVGRV